MLSSLIVNAIQLRNRTGIEVFIGTNFRGDGRSPTLGHLFHFWTQLLFKIAVTNIWMWAKKPYEF